MANNNQQVNEDKVSYLPPTIAQQTYSIASGIAGGLAGFVLARRLSGVQNVPAAQVIGAAILSATVTFGAVYIINPKS